jgi:hypothetical protein
MDYFKHYTLLVERARLRVIDEYTEIHHVVPKCMNGDDSKENLVRLTPEEHYLAHQLLVKMYPDNQRLSHAANMMCVNRTSNKLYGWLRRRLSYSMSANNPNKGGVARREYNKLYGAPNKGYKHSEQTRRLISERHMGSNNPNKDGKARLTVTRLVHETTGQELIYNSLKEAEKAHKANHASVYNNRKAGRPYRGYYWYVGS